MTDDEKMEFWKSLGRLYDETVALRDSIVELRDTTAKANADLQNSISGLIQVADLHERRLSRLESGK